MAKLKDNIDFKGIKRVYILLGPACNMMCRHCSQMPIKHDCNKTDSISKSVWKFLDNYISYVVKNQQKGLVIFWGGEPLLHWNVIQQIVTHFTDKYDLLSVKNAMFAITTNGLLLNEDKVGFLNKYNIKVSLSYDAPYPFAVRGKIPESVCTTAKKIKLFSTISTFNAINYDYYLAIRCLNKKFPNVLHRFNFGLTQTFNMPDDIFTFNLNKLHNSIRKLRIAASLGNTEAINAFRFLLMPLYDKKQNDDFRKYFVKTCCTGFSSYSVTLDGKIISCHNSDECVGTLEENTDVVNETSRKALLSRKGTDCEKCEHTDICTGRCTISLKNKDGNFKICDLFWKPFYFILKQEGLLLCQSLSVEDKKWFDMIYKKDNEFVNNF